MITVSHLTKYYGRHLAVSDLSFEIGEGHVYGFLGPNGAGKSTTMNIMTGCLSATEGSVSIDGYDIFEDPKAAKKLIGYLPEQPPLYLGETPEEYLRFVGEAKGLRGEKLRAEIESAVESTGIESVRNRRIGTLSKGYRQRVGIAQALLGDPRVIILDEPTVGLDPIQILEIRDLIRQLGRTHTVIFSSHILSEVQAICDRLLIIANGRLVAQGEPEALERELAGDNEILFTADTEAFEAAEILFAVEGLHALSVREEDGVTVFRLSAGSGNVYDLTRAIFRAFAENGVAILEMSVKKASLEDIFLELTEKDGTAPSESGGEEKDRLDADSSLAPQAEDEEEDAPINSEREATDHDGDTEA